MEYGGTERNRRYQVFSKSAETAKAWFSTLPASRIPHDVVLVLSCADLPGTSLELRNI
jgi:hypothetical protein